MLLKKNKKLVIWMTEKFYTANEIAELLQVSYSKARQIMMLLKAKYQITDDMLPRRGVIPECILVDHFGKKAYLKNKKDVQ